VRGVDHALRDRDVLFEWVVRGVDHHRAEEAGVDALVARLFIAVIQVDRENGLGKNLARRSNDRLEHPLVGVFARALGNLNDEWRLRFDAALEKPHRLLGVVDVVGADGIFAVSVPEQLRGGYDHGRR
jgi:hypothetical protein